MEFEHGLAREGPGSVGQTLSEWEDQGGSIGEFAETLLNRCVHAARDVATEGIPIILNRWETSVLDRARQPATGDGHALTTLSDIASMVDFVDATAQNVLLPTGGEPDYYITRGSASDGIRAAATETTAAISSLRERVRSGLALFSAVSTSQALRLAQQTQISSERFQRVISVLGAVILGPAVVTGVYGANTALPGKDTWAGFGIMMGAIVLSGLALLGTLRWLGSRSETDDQDAD